ncbi:DNA-binding transcriptional regulator GbsR, MarR family [Rhodonellum ikkaensis]|nr:DNA-binding transcriptional regulator GbsR, MarR family [Rhodonellum ikkaensis]
MNKQNLPTFDPLNPLIFTERMAQILNEKQKELIEKIGVIHEQHGMQPLMGRILGLILVIEEAEVTFDDIVAHLNVSKSAVSYALNFLQLQRFVIYRTKPGERKRYFYLDIEDWDQILKKELCNVADINSFFKEVIELRGNAKPEFNNKLKDLCEFLEYLKEEIPLMFERFKKNKS